MSDLGPFAVRAGILQRFPHFIDLMVRQRLGTSAYRLWGAPTINDAYGDFVGSGVGGTGGSMLLTTPKDRIAQSAQASRAGAAQAAENRTGHACFQLDPEDYTPLVNGDAEVSFYRVQEKRATTGDWLTVVGAINNGEPLLGPILPVPAGAFYGMQTATLAFSGIAPSLTGCVAGKAPVIDETVQTPLPMHIALPRPAARLQIFNHGGTSVGAADAILLVSFDRGPMVRVFADESLDIGGFGHMAGLVSEIFLAVEDDAGGLEFSVSVGIDSGVGG